MEDISQLEINIDGMQESLQEIETLLNEIILDRELTMDQVREKATQCMEAVNRYTKVANRNVRLLNEQAMLLFKKVQQIQQETRKDDPSNDSEYDIN